MRWARTSGHINRQTIQIPLASGHRVRLRHLESSAMLRGKMKSFRSAIFYLGLVVIGAAGTHALAQERGVALFAMMSERFPCEQGLKFFEPGADITALSILWSTFGNDPRCVTEWAAKMAKSGRKHTLQIHLSNETCRRAKNRKCSEAELSSGMSVSKYNRALESLDPAAIGALELRIKEVREFADRIKTPSMELILSTGLEDNFSLAAYKVVLERVRANWPHLVVRNPVEFNRQRDQLSADIYELHGPNPPFLEGQKCIANLDGVDIVFPHRRSPTSERVSWKDTVSYLERYRERCRIAFLWSAPWQGLHSDKFPLVEQRRFVVSDEDVAAIRGIVQPVPEALGRATSARQVAHP